MADRIETDLHRKDHPLVNQLLAFRDSDDGKAYFETGIRTADIFDLGDTYREWQKSPDRTGFEAQHPELEKVFKLSAAKRDRMRTRNRDLERLLFAWGYITSPKNPHVKLEVARLRRSQGGVITDTSSLLRTGVSPGVEVSPEPVLSR